MIKSYTDLEQSKKLAEILPIESADMYYYPFNDDYAGPVIGIADKESIPCWSLASLLGVLPRIEGFKPVLDLEINYVQYPSDIDLSATAGNPVDACVAMIEKLHELKML